MLLIHAIWSDQGWTARPYSWREGWHSSAFPMAAATAAETSFSAAQR
jgi:hypothetical protein